MRSAWVVRSRSDGFIRGRWIALRGSGIGRSLGGYRTEEFSCSTPWGNRTSFEVGLSRKGEAGRVGAVGETGPQGGTRDRIGPAEEAELALGGRSRSALLTVDDRGVRCGSGGCDRGGGPVQAASLAALRLGLPCDGRQSGWLGGGSLRPAGPGRTGVAVSPGCAKPAGRTGRCAGWDSQRGTRAPCRGLTSGGLQTIERHHEPERRSDHARNCADRKGR
jgi:hypothetical protein